MLKRHEIQVLRRAQHTWSEIATLSGVSAKTARRIAAEEPVTEVDNAAERSRRQVGRPSKADAYRDVLEAMRRSGANQARGRSCVPREG